MCAGDFVCCLGDVVRARLDWAIAGNHSCCPCLIIARRVVRAVGGSAEYGCAGGMCAVALAVDNICSLFPFGPMMKAQDYPAAVLELMMQLKRMPGIGSRGAERYALWFLQHGRQEARQLAAALVQAADTIATCPECGFFAPRGERCTACNDPARDQNILCVVEQPTDVLPIERSGVYHGLYHCLGGKISPLDGVMPEDLAVERLMERVRSHPGCEVVIAVGSDVEGEATALYLAEQLSVLDCRVSRLAQGMPAGAGLGHTDPLTLMRALQGRQWV